MKIPSKPVVTLNDDITCRGSITLGTGCMSCKKCLEQWNKLYGDKEPKENLELRMYSLVMYNLSPIQQGIQAGHSIVEYSIKPDEAYKNWAENWKTMIVLNGGTSSTMVEHIETLTRAGVKAFPFYEPDLNDSLSAISFVVDERVFNKKKYPNEEPAMIYTDGSPLPPSKEWIDSIGGEKNMFLREFLSKFRLV